MNQLMGGDMARCSECGFLAVRDINSNEMGEALEITRSTGQHKNMDGKTRPAKVFCYAPSEAFPAIQSEAPGRQIAECINEERKCDLFVGYLPGRTPQEHYKMCELREQREFNRRMLKEDREWRESQEKTSTRRFWIGLTVTVVITGILVSIAQIIAGLIAAGRLP